MSINSNYYIIRNKDNKVWLMPTKDLRIAMELYQPSGLKGKMLKYWFPLIHRLNIVRKLIRAENTSHILSECLRNVIAKSFEISSFGYSIFGGSPGPRQKKTIQIFNNGHILGYVKLSDNSEIASLFQKEAEALKFLKDRNITNVPDVLYCDKLADEWVFIQSTSKTIHSKTVNNLSPKHIQFVRSLFEQTKKTLMFEQTDLYSDICYLKSNMESFPHEDREILIRSINLLEDHYDGEVVFGFMHGDFTPWNLYFEKDTLYAFDFEYAGYSYPPYIDIIHFILQVGILVKNQNIEEIYKALRANEHWLPNNERKRLIIAYLISIFSHYSKLFNGNFNPQDRSYRTWIGLMDKYNQL